ncbi:ATP-binding protein [uncultured Thiocystis sp.]|jgi:PAS domain S-box-containing protein|uniref:PAS domain-containing hybrid sensor histidine kinase/response regulator n=1 Tax=uncultured Thiocystis sp. TaxID=1202134 RepID=UPI0025FC8A5B|nr:ATP-binding protein [uncultured Thiocystis sp.]
MSADTLDDTAELCLIRSAGELFHLVRDGVLITDVTPRIIAVNSAFTRITGYAECDVKGLNPNFLKSGRHAPDFYRRLWQKLIEDGHWHGEIWNRRKNGEEYLALLTIRAIRNAQGEGFGYLGVFGDQSQAKREQELEAAKHAAEDAARAKAQFLANMSHEIRTPLTAIIGFAETMIDSRQTLAERAQAVDIIIHNGRHLQSLLNDILDFSKIQAKRIEVEDLETSLPDLLAGVVEVARAQAEEKKLEFGVHFMPPLPLTIHTDPTRARQILMNLLNNAIKFTDTGAVRLIVSFSPEQEQLHVAVQDTGCGIEESQLMSLFEPFAQEDRSISRRFGGTGLGLSISKELAENLGGGIRVTSFAGIGSVFVAMLATGRVAAADLSWDIRAFNQSSQVSPVRTVRPPTLSGRILVVDDNRANQELISLYLRRCGLAAEIAGNGQEAVEMAQQSVFDLVLMDMRMPVMGGLDATEILRLTGFSQPIVALSANIDRPDIEAALAAGCDAYLPKPIHLDTFYQMLARYLPNGETNRMTPGLIDCRVGEDPELERLRAEFLAELPVKMAKLRTAFAAGDQETLRSQAHQIKGVGANFGMPELTRLAGAMEFQLLRGDLGEVACLLDDMERSWQSSL